MNVNPLGIALETFLRGFCPIEDVLKVAWPDGAFDWHQIALIDAGMKALKPEQEFREIVAKGCTGAGKNAAVAALACLWFESGDQAQVVINSQSTQHAVEVAFSEVKQWRKRMRYATPCDELETKIKAGDKHSIVVANPEKPESFSGRHGASGVLIIFDECTGTSTHLFDVAKTQARLMVLLGNPRVNSGYFRRCFGDDEHCDDPVRDVILASGAKRRLITVSGESCANVKQQKRIIPGQISYQDYAEIAAHPDENYRRIFAFGKFPIEDAELQLILPSWLDRHVAAYDRGIHPDGFGLDVGDSEHGDWTVCAAVGRDGLVRLMRRRKTDLMATCGWLLSQVKQYFRIDLTDGECPITVDADGVGKGIADRLAEIGCWVIPFRGSEMAFDRRAYMNKRAEAYAVFGKRLDPSEGHGTFGLPDDQILLDDLCAAERIYDSDGVRFRIQPKDLPSGAKSIKNHRGDIISTVKQKLGRSPDRGDACVYGYYSIFVLMGGTEENFEAQEVPKGEVVAFVGDDKTTPKKVRDETWDSYFSELGDLLDDLEHDEDDKTSYKLD